jgi:error-prone DNA polymerase
MGEEAVLGLAVGKQVMSLYRPWLNEPGILGSQALAGCANGRIIRVGGLLVVHQAPPTANGFHLLTLEDEDGLMNVIVAPGVNGCYRQVIRGARLLLPGGTVQQEEGVTSLLVGHLAQLPV